MMSALVHYTVQDEPGEEPEVHTHIMSFELSTRGLDLLSQACAVNFLNGVGGWLWPDSVAIGQTVMTRLCRKPPRVVPPSVAERISRDQRELEN